jgi:hypothetical protein
MNYYITELFVCNHDWLYQNIKCWRNHSYGGKWRWLLYDLDWGFSGELPWKTEDYMDNTFQWVQEQGDASLLFRKLMENEDFRFEFIQRFATHLNLTFNTDRVLFTIENMADWIAPEIPRQIERWGALRSIEYWNEQLNILKEFAINRPLYMGEHLDVTYLMEGKSNLVLEVSNEESGWISVFDTPCPGPSFSGTWYDGIPLQIKAHPKPGWRFVQWIGDYQSQEEVIEISFLNNAVLHAQFEPYDQPALMISEIHYNPSSDFQGDDEEFEFLELFNYEKERVDLSAYQFTEGITFTFPEGSYIDPGEFLLLASNLSSYDNSGVKCFQVSSGRLDNAGEVICLRDPGNIIIDQVHFDDHYPWPRKPDGDGPSLELIAPMLDNALPTSWQASAQIGGSPGYGHYTHIQKIKSPGNSLFMSVWPNPFYHNTKIRYSLDEESRISIRIFNSNGQEVEHLMKAKLLPGVHELMWTPSNIPEGIYFIHLLRGENIHTQKVFYSGKE